MKSTPGRDPRGNTVSFVYLVKVNENSTPIAGDDAATAKFYDLKEILNNKEKFAFDHYEILSELVLKLSLH